MPQAFVSPWFVSDSKRGHWLEECFASKSGAAAEESMPVSYIVSSAISCQVCMLCLIAFFNKPGCTEGRNLHDEALTQQLYEIKEQFDSIPPDVFWRSRAATNPYERIGITTIVQTLHRLEFINFQVVF